MAKQAKVGRSPSSPIVGTIQEVLEATQVHLKTLRIHASHHAAKPDPAALRDVIEGLGISADKLRLALEQSQNASPAASPARIVIALADGRITGVMSAMPGLTAEVFDFDKRVRKLVDGKFAVEPNSGKAAEQVDRDFAEATAGMADVLAAAKMPASSGGTWISP